MPLIYLLDAGPIGLLAHNRLIRRVAIESWLMKEMAGGATVYLSEVADFEVRRELIRLIQAGQLPASRMTRLNQLQTIFTYLPVTTVTWRRAAEFWADTRSQGLPTTSPDSLDADSLIAAQADNMKATVVTSNPTHIGRWVPIHPWP